MRYTKPPVREVTLGIWFDALRTLNALDLHKLRSDWLEDFPAIEELAPFPSWDAPNGGYSFVDTQSKWPMPCCVFSSQFRDRQVLVQDDRFSLSWTFNSNAGSYPGFEKLYEDLASRFEQFCAEITSAGNPSPIVRRVTVEYSNHLIDLDSEFVANSVLQGKKINGKHSAGRDSVSLRKHYCATGDNGDIALLLMVQPDSHFGDEENPDEERDATRLTINTSAEVEKGQPPLERLRASHDAELNFFLSLFSDEMRASWGEQDA
ncbi:MAG: TIGR04255 family protein [Umezawaea sp.]